MAARSVLGFFALVSVAALAGACASSTEDVGSSAATIDYICNEKASATLDGIPAYAYCGNFNVWSNNGVDVKSTSGGNGWVQTEGGYGYQCVEYAVRYEHFKFGVKTGWGISYAKQMCATHPSSMSVTTKPVHGDLAIFGAGSCGADATAGHVAVVSSVTSTNFTAVQENSAGTYTWKKTCASCFLHATANNGSTDPCAAAANGDYCGASSQFTGGTKGTLYTCKGGATASKTVCPNGCKVMPPGQPDVCAPAADAGPDAATDAATDGAATDDAATDATPADDAAPPPADTDGGPVSDVPGQDGGCQTSGHAPTGSAWLVALGLFLAVRRRRARE